jgi:hypothetical protein
MSDRSSLAKGFVSAVVRGQPDDEPLTARDLNRRIIVL